VRFGAIAAVAASPVEHQLDEQPSVGLSPLEFAVSIKIYWSD